MKHSKFLRRLLAGAVTLAIAVSMVLPAMAVNTTAITDTGDITVNAPTGTSADGLTVTAYKVLDKVASDELEGEDATKANSATSLYTVTAAFENLFSDARTAYQNGLQDAEKLKVTYENNALSLVAAGAGDTGVAGQSIIIDNSTGNKLDTSDKFFAASLIAHIVGDGQGSTAAKVGTAADAATFSDWVTRYALAKGVTVAKSADFTTDSTTANSVTLKDLSYGYYVVVISKRATNITPETVIQHSILNLAGGNVDMTAKLGTITLDKMVENETKPDSASATDKSSTSAAIGDTLKYTLASQIPDLSHYDFTSTLYGGLVGKPSDGADDTQYHYYFVDTLTNQELLAPANGVFTLTFGEKKATYSITTTADNSTTEQFTVDNNVVAEVRRGDYNETTGKQEFQVVFDLKALAEAGLSGKAVTLTYRAKLKDEAVTVNPNEVTLHYSNDPYTASGDTLTDKTEVYTYELDVTKSFSDGSTDYSKVTFRLSEDGKELKFLENKDTDGKLISYTLLDDQAQNGVQDLKLTDAGKLVLHGLGEAVYTLTETNAPSGYVKAGPFTVTLKANDKAPETLGTVGTKDDGTKTFDTKVTVTVPQKVSVAFEPLTGTGDNVHGIAFTVLNQKGFTLPITGSEGTWLLTVGGILLFAAAAAVLYLARKKKN